MRTPQSSPSHPSISRRFRGGWLALVVVALVSSSAWAKTGRELLDAGKAAYAEKNYQQAATLFHEAYKKDSTLTLALYNKAFALRKAGQYDKARAAYKTFLKVVPGDLDGLFGLAETERLLGNDDEARKRFAEYVKKETRADKAKYVSYAKKKLSQQATAPADRTARLVDEGKAAFAAKKYDQSEQAFAQVLAFDPTHQEALYRRALALRKGERYPDAIKAYGAFRRQAPQDLDGLFGLAETYRLAGKKEQAKKLFKQYVSAEDRAERASYKSYATEQLAVLDGKAPVVGGATEDKKATPSDAKKTTAPAAKRLKPSDIAAAANLMADGDAAFKKKKYKEAAALYKKARERNPGAVRTLYKEALARRQAGEYKAAIDLYTAYSVEKPHDPDALYGLAVTHEKLGNITAAADAYRRYIAKEDRASEQKYVAKAKAYVAAADEARAALKGRTAKAAPEKAPAKDGEKTADVAKKPSAEQAKPAPPPPDVKVSAADKKAAKNLAERASTAYRAKKYGRAADQYAAAYKKNPNDHALLYRRALALRKAGDLAGAKAAYTTFLTRVPDDVDAVYGLATTCKLLDDVTCARANYAQYIRREKRASEKKYVALAQTYLVEHPEDVVAAAGANEGGEAGTPLSKHGTRHQHEAAAALHEEAGPHPHHASRHGKHLSVASLIAHGEDALKQGNIQSAEEHAAMARALAPRNPRALLLLGDVRAAQGNTEAAKKAYTRVSEDPDAAAFRDTALARLNGEMPAAQAQTTRGSGLANDEQKAAADTLVGEARKMFEDKRADDALAAADEALKLNPRSYGAQQLRGDIFIKRRRGVYALQAYQRALASQPGAAAPLFGIAQAYELIGERGMSKRYYKNYAASEADDVDSDRQREAFLKVEGAL